MVSWSQTGNVCKVSFLLLLAFSMAFFNFMSPLPHILNRVRKAALYGRQKNTTVETNLVRSYSIIETSNRSISSVLPVLKHLNVSNKHLVNTSRKNSTSLRSSAGDTKGHKSHNRSKSNPANPISQSLFNSSLHGNNFSRVVHFSYQNISSLNLSSKTLRSNASTNFKPSAHGMQHNHMSASANKSVFCRTNPKVCAYGEKTIRLLATRRIIRNSNSNSNRDVVSIYVDWKLRKFFKDPFWLKNTSLRQCSVRCSVTTQPSKADVHLVSLKPPSKEKKRGVYGVLNLEAHSFSNLPLHRKDWILISYHQSSDVVVTYGYSVIHNMGLCVGYANPTGCDNTQKKQSRFFKWCHRSFSGHLFTCIFNVMPHIVRTNDLSRSNKSLAVTWISASCKRHNNYLQELMMYIKVDSMGKCYRNCDENKHVGLTIQDKDGLWGGKIGSLHLGDKGKRGSKKIILASQYLFFISIENTILADYVTEKFFEGFLADTLLVYLGAPNAKRYAPADHSFVDASDFAGPKELATYLLHLVTDSAAYEAYFAWRRRVPVLAKAAFQAAINQSLTHTDARSIMCRTCNSVRNLPVQ